MPSHEQMREAVLAYARFLSQADVDKVMSLFAPDAVIEDPVGQGEYRGHDAIRGFFEQGFATVNGEMRMEPEGAVRLAERHAACAMIVTCPRADEPFWMETLDVWSFAEDGRFATMHAYWGPSNFHPLPDQSGAEGAGLREAALR